MMYNNVMYIIRSPTYGTNQLLNLILYKGLKRPSIIILTIIVTINTKQLTNRVKKEKENLINYKI